ncbi:MAG: hypothetical protein DHS20C21_12460 [Gemmatimonadota bacterium]|nr:MAG: hypothetical protein DHS20C21_12460 [Gemmatimonadota bacterium]
MSLNVDPSTALQVGFVALAVGMTVFFSWWTGLRAIPIAWLAATGIASALGVFQDFSLPPRLVLLFLPAAIAATIFTWRADWHQRPLSLLVGFQSFRILVEILIHRAASEGVAPPQLSWEGRNLDIVTGVSALLLAPVASRLPRLVLHAWNAVGAGLLINVVGVAVLSMPTPFQVFEPDNLWVGFFPFSWLPLILVMIAWIGHVALWKRLRQASAV